MKLSQRIGRVGASPTLAISAQAKALRAQGRDVIGFGAGEPDFDTPEAIKAAAERALAEGKTKYSPPAGEVPLRQALAERYRQRFGLDYGTDQIFVSNGAKHTLFNLFSAILDPGDEVLIVAPYWVSYPAQVLLADGRPVVVQGRAVDHFCPRIADLDKAVSARTRALVLNSPGNPTGAVWTLAQLKALGDWLGDHPDIIGIYDGIYAELIYEGGVYHELAAVSDGLAEQVVCVNGVSKSFAMTGWRIGWAAGPERLIKAAAKFQSQTTSGPNTIAQWAALAALSLDDGVVASMRETYDQRRTLMCERLEAIPHLALSRPQGAFYAFADLSAYIGGQTASGAIDGDLDLATYLLDQVGVAVVPGSAFGAPGYARLTYACDEATIRGGVERIADALAAVRLPDR